MTLSNSAWDGLDAELGRWLRLRASARVTHRRTASPLDEVATGLERVKSTLDAVARAIDVNDTHTPMLIMRAYRWSIRVARELEAIERLELDPIKEWARFEAFAPFAVAFFDSVLAAPCSATPRSTEVARLRREIDAVLAPLTLAMASSALAA